MAVAKIDPKVIFASEAPAQDAPAVFTNKTVGWGESRKNGGRPTIKQSNALQQETDLKILWLNENSVTPFDATIDYPENAVTIKDGAFKIFNGSAWNLFLSKASVGLNNVDNTSDINKPISTATATALNLKADKATTYTKVEVDATIDLLKPPYLSSNVINASGETQQQVNYNGGAKWHSRVGGYLENERVVLANGDIVKSTDDGNVNDPNVDMTGWVKTNSASQIFDVSGKSQEAINSDVFSLTKTSAQKFTDFANAVDAAPIIQTYANSLNDGDTLLIPSGKWAIKTACVINKAINIKCDGELVVSGDVGSVVNFRREAEYTLSGGDLSQLPKRGDTKLYLNNTSLFDPAEYYFSLISTEVEIVRIGFADPYYKNETLDFIDSNFNLRGQVDLDYTDASKLAIHVFKKKQPVKVQLNLSMIPNVGQTNGARILEAFGVSNIIWDLSIDRSNSKNIAGNSFLYNRCALFTFTPRCRVNGGQSDNGDSYAFLNSTSSYILHYGVNYNDGGATSKKERGYAARHGKYVYFNKCFLNGIDDHYGHHYYINNTDFTHRGIAISGGSVHIDNCKQYSPTEALMSLRTDTPYADGDLVITNSWVKSNLFAASSANNVGYNSKYKAWDIIRIKDCSADINTSHVITIGSFYTQNVNTRTKRFELINFNYAKDASSTKALISTGGQEAWVDDIFIDGVHSLDGVVSNSRFFMYMLASNSVTLNNIPLGIDGLWTAPKIDISKSKLGYAPSSIVSLIAPTVLNISNSGISNDCSAYTSSADTLNINLFNNVISTTKFTGNANIGAGISSAYGNKTTVALGYYADLRSYQRTKLTKYIERGYAIPSLALGAVGSIQTDTVNGARVGDFVDVIFTTAMNGLRINASVTASDQVKWYVENPSNNPFGAFTGVSANIKINLRN